MVRIPLPPAESRPHQLIPRPQSKCHRAVAGRAREPFDLRDQGKVRNELTAAAEVAGSDPTGQAGYGSPQRLGSRDGNSPARCTCSAPGACSRIFKPSRILRCIDCARRTMIRILSARRDCGRGCLMGKAHLVVRAEVPDPADWAAFDHCYATDHLPWAMRITS